MKRATDDDDTHRAAARRGTRLTLSISGGGARIAARIRAAAEAALSTEGIHRGCLDVAVVDEPTMCRLHADHLDDDSPTDVLSFDLREKPLPGAIDGQIIVCQTVARRVARERGTRWSDELLLYVIHGCLHLAGYDDRTAAQAAPMHAREDELLTLLGVGRVFKPATKPPARRSMRANPTQLSAATRRRRSQP